MMTIRRLIARSSATRVPARAGSPRSRAAENHENVSAAALTLLVDVGCQPVQNQIGDLIVVPVLHEHVAVAEDS